MKLDKNAEKDNDKTFQKNLTNSKFYILFHLRIYWPGIGSFLIEQNELFQRNVFLYHFFPPPQLFKQTPHSCLWVFKGLFPLDSWIIFYFWKIDCVGSCNCRMAVGHVVAKMIPEMGLQSQTSNEDLCYNYHLPTRLWFCSIAIRWGLSFKDRNNPPDSSLRFIKRRHWLSIARWIGFYHVFIAILYQSRRRTCLFSARKALTLCVGIWANVLLASNL